MSLEERIRKFISDMRKVTSAVVPAVVANDLQEIVDGISGSKPRATLTNDLHAAAGADLDMLVGRMFRGPATDYAFRRWVQSGGKGIVRIANERRRHLEVEGWTPKHDAAHKDFDLAAAASSYAYFASLTDIRRSSSREQQDPDDRSPNWWPWESTWWKPGSDNSDAARIRELEKAGALIAAEIDRLLCASVEHNAFPEQRA